MPKAMRAYLICFTGRETSKFQQRVNNLHVTVLCCTDKRCKPILRIVETVQKCKLFQGKKIHNGIHIFTCDCTLASTSVRLSNKAQISLCPWSAAFKSGVWPIYTKYPKHEKWLTLSEQIITQSLRIQQKT